MSRASANSSKKYARPEYLRIDDELCIRIYVDGVLTGEHPVTKERVAINAVQCVAFLAENVARNGG